MKATSKQIIEALDANGGFTSKAAEVLGMTYQAVNRRINKNEKIKAAYNAIKESHLDFAESKLMSLIKGGNLGAICFYLKCQGKHRGWVERQEVTGGDGGPIIFKVIYEEEPTNGD